MTPYIATGAISPKMIGAPPPLEGPRVTLDQASFRALASEVRVEVLKRLDERRMTVTDLANALDLSKPTLLEHLEKLQTAELVKRIDEGRKWIYYELTGRGKKILHPERVTIVVSLCLSFFLAAAGIVAIASGLTSGVMYGPGAGPSSGLQCHSALSCTYGPPILLICFRLAAAVRWFMRVALYFNLRGDKGLRTVFARVTKQKTVSLWELLGYLFGVGVIGGLVTFWPAIVAGLQSLALPGGSTRPGDPGASSTSGPIPVSTAFPIAVVVFVSVVIAIYVFALASRILPRLIDAVKGGEPTPERRRLEG